MLLFNQAPFTGRANFGWMLNGLDLRERAVEVGTHRGVFANLLLRSWAGKMLYLVDPYESGYDPSDPASQGDRMADMQAMTELLKPHSHRYQLLRQQSVIVASTFGDESLDFVYIDACHKEDAVLLDLHSWWPKVRQGGVLAGHDFAEYSTAACYNIQKALTRFERNLGVPQLLCQLVVEPDGAAWSFYVIKP